MKTVVALSCLLSISMAAVLPDLPDDWLSFKAKYNKSYDGDVDALRSKIFQQNVNKINLHNQKFEDGLVTYFLGVNHFADMLESEVSEKWTGYNKGVLSEPRMSTPYEPSNRTLPSSIDWRKKGAVTPVKNQGSCGSCWTFSAVAALEGQNAIKTGKLVSLSEEQLLECDKGAKACNGGDPSQAFEYLKSAGGIETEKSYPYTSGHDGNVGPCKFNRSKVAVQVTGYKKIPHDDENALQDAVANIGPISIAIDVTIDLIMYQGGVLCGFGCDASILGHAVVIVGYGEDPKYGPYWLVKNSWGERWGDDGYFKVCRNQDNELCVAIDANVPTV